MTDKTEKLKKTRNKRKRLVDFDNVVGNFKKNKTIITRVLTVELCFDLMVLYRSVLDQGAVPGCKDLAQTNYKPSVKSKIN